MMGTVHLADPRERALRPLLIRRDALMRARSEAVDLGQIVDSAELEQVEDEIRAIRLDEHPAVELTQECHGRGCKKQVDVRKDAHYQFTLKSARRLDPTKPAGQQVEWVYPPSLADVITCVKCGEGLLARHAEQRVEG